ncbi:MAG: hypothetical protein K2I03_10105 [Lachnospiraceae bacterium]|nr:hypothetical protein [Lachnospiraceae bacterium]MDE6232999.1 hypothetical protein [Lachnospiraceae bacterium]MDE6253890.1 hypothetical protein [Lachnospiraceae bacterium]
MSISVNMDVNGQLFEIPVATTEFFKIYWERAIEECDLQVFQEYNYFGKEQISKILSELELLKKWSEKNLNGKEYVYMNERIEELKKEIPKVFEWEENAILCID